MHAGMFTCFLFFVLVIIMSFLQKFKCDDINHSVLFISAIVILSLTILTIIGLACYGKIKKEIENENESNHVSMPDDVIPPTPPEIYVTANSRMDFDQDIFYVMEKLENQLENNSCGNLPTYNLAILNCAPIKIVSKEDIKSQTPPPYYCLSSADPPPDYCNTNNATTGAL